MRSARFRLLLLAVAASLLLLVPCFWLPQIESFDLASHIYNAWLTQLINQQHISGLWITDQTTNILFGNVLSLLLRAFTPSATQRIAVAAAVLLFVWSAFALAAVISEQRPWFLLLCFAMLAYGRIFHYGFFDFYISASFAFLALALLWKPRWWHYLLLVPVLALSWAGHPLPVVCAVSLASYVHLARRTSRKGQCALWAAAVLALCAIGSYERLSYPKVAGAYHGVLREALGLFGWDQVLALNRKFSPLSYRVVELGILAILGLLLAQILRRNRQFLFSIPMQMYTLTCVAGFVLPGYKFYFPATFKTPLEYIAERISLFAAVLSCCVVARATPKKWQQAMLLGFAGVFFVTLYQSERSLAKLEAKVNELVSQLPPGQRVAAILPSPDADNGFTEDLVDRACVGRCYDYGNYEPSTLQFRIRAAANNPFVLANAADSEKLGEGSYRVLPRDIPLYQVYRCGPKITDLCMRALKVGEVNGSFARETDSHDGPRAVSSRLRTRMR